MTNNSYPSTTYDIFWAITQLLEKKKLEMDASDKIIYQNVPWEAVK